jgi:hypothetical protein
MHANFLAESKGGTSCAELVPKYFFAELRIGPEGKEKMRCVSCIKMDPGVLILNDFSFVFTYFSVIFCSFLLSFLGLGGWK